MSDEGFELLLAGAVRELDEQPDPPHTLQVAALETRTVIGQATGILMERFHLDGDTAFGVLRRISNQENIKLRDLAMQVVSTRRLPHRDAPAQP